MKLYSLFYAEEFNHTEGWGAVTYHGTFSNIDLARACAGEAMQKMADERVQEYGMDDEEERGYREEHAPPTPEAIWTEWKWGTEPNAEWQIVAVNLDQLTTGAHLT